MIDVTYKAYNKLDKAALYCDVESANDLGYLDTTPVVSFRLDKSLVTSINWDHFDGARLSKVFPGFRIAPSFAKRLSAEGFGS